jgi:hypothetical protein
MVHIVGFLLSFIYFSSLGAYLCFPPCALFRSGVPRLSLESPRSRWTRTPINAAQNGIRAMKNQNLPNQCTGNSRHTNRDARSPLLRGSCSSRILTFVEGRSVLYGRASIPRILQLSVGRSRGEAVGRIQTLIGTPERFFYTGMPPTVLGGSYPLLVFIRPLLVWRGG